MSLEKDFLNCKNAFSSICDPWMSDNITLKPIKPGEEIPELNLIKADEICANCEHFDLN